MPLRQKECAVLFNPEARGVEVQLAAALSVSRRDIRPSIDAASKIELKAKRLRRWDVQCAWLEYAAYQAVHHCIDTASREQNSSALNAFGQERLPGLVLVVRATQGALVDMQALVSEAQKLS